MASRLRRRHQTAPSQAVAKRHLDLDDNVGEIYRSPKRRRTNPMPVDNDVMTTKSFYGGREKKSFPHSPGRRKAVSKVLDKLSDENTDSDSDRGVVEKRKPVKRPSFDFHSTSTDTEEEMNVKIPLKEKIVQAKGRARKAPLEIYVTKRTPKNKSINRGMSKSTGKLPKKTESNFDNNEQRTPIISGKKFFKTRSPGSACVTTGSIVRKGFDLKFVARKLKVSATPVKGKTSKQTSSKTKTVPVKSVKLNSVRKDKVIGATVSLHGKHSTKDKQISDTSTELEDSVFVSTPVQLSDVNKDSAIDTATSGDLFSSLDEVNNQHITKSFGPLKNTDDDDESVTDDTGELNSIMDNGSVDLFSVTPDSGRTTPSNDTPVSSGRGTPMSMADSDVQSSVTSGPVSSNKGPKLFSIFTKQGTPSPSVSSRLRNLRSASKSPSLSPLLRSTKVKDKMEQMIIDAGQKRYGVTQCDTCGMVYNIADPDDETTHFKYHQSTLAALKFPGWKKENVIQEFPMFGSRIIKVVYESPKYALKKIEEVNKVMNSELGSPEQSFNFRPTYQVFLYVSDKKQVDGCCIAEPLTEGYPVIPDIENSQSSQNHPGNRPWYCSDTPVPAKLGISRIWVHSGARRQRIASKLLDCVRQWFSYGCLISKKAMAFSDPTQNGKALAIKYTANPQFLVYKFKK